MRRSLSRLTHPRTHPSRTTARPRPRLERLEDRLAPAVTDLFVTTQTATAPGSLFKEYTTTGTLIRSVSIPITGGTEFARDLAFNARQPLVYNGTFSPQLSAYDSVAGTWSNTAGPAGWSTTLKLACSPGR